MSAEKIPELRIALRGAAESHTRATRTKFATRARRLLDGIEAPPAELVAEVERLEADLRQTDLFDREPGR